MNAFISSPGSKQVLRDGEHFADAVSPEAAELIVRIMNKHLKSRRDVLEAKRQGGYGRAAKLPPERRSEIARNAALARWRKP